MRSRSCPWLALSLCLLLRTTLMPHPYSGERAAPRFGDYEAQRHWQELTLNVELDKWYGFDLDYWGLDYPPLTAYHSLLMGKVAEAMDPSWVALNASRGMESDSSKLYMRSTVLMADVLILLPSLALLGDFDACKIILLGAYPGLILIDNGHFQYNNISLGLFILALSLFFKDRTSLGSIVFCLALNYKQMELYHALPIFSYLLGITLKQPKPILNLLRLALVVLVTFGLIWLPFLMQGEETVLQVVHRIFPLKRGVFEDKVASFWCSLNILIKIREMLNTQQLVKMCLAVTALAVLPTNICLMIRPTQNNLLLALVNTSLAFFLFSFHVHEKSILLVAMPVAVLLARRSGSRYSSMVCTLFLIVSVLSMFPLLHKDQLVIPCLSLTALYGFVCLRLGCFNPLVLRPQQSKTSKRVLPIELPRKIDTAMQVIATVIIVTLSILCVAMWIRPKFSDALPDLWPVLISCFSCLVFGLFFMLGHVEQIFSHPELEANLSNRK